MGYAPWLLIAASIVATPAFAADVVVFGDSWARGAADELEDVLWDHDQGYIRVANHAVSGTTAEYWATQDRDALHQAVTENPDARWVWLSIGGNDVFWHHHNGLAATSAADNDVHIRQMLDDLFAVHPDVKVVLFGYDFLNFEQSTDCIALAFSVFGQDITTPQVNAIFLLEVGAVQATLAEDHPNVTYVDSVWGTLQAAGGVPGAPNADLPSPEAYFSDCIHPNSTGYTLIMDALHEDYWGRAAPVADFSVSDPGPEVGEVVVFTSTGTGSDRLAWTLDGLEAGHEPWLEWTADTVGPHTITLRADAGAWDDTHTEVIEVHPGATDDSDDPEDTDPTGDPTVVAEGSCGCATGSEGGAWGLPGLLLLWTGRRRRPGAALTRT
ncbi:MAG: MYXO-CTERM sorting domain-containing protein [Deltaproteobacteria bacterium]|nr:MYXO-CTERM sorting domain-containing protein [Deltaproteobacteria bacterium]